MDKADATTSNVCKTQNGSVSNNDTRSQYNTHEETSTTADGVCDQNLDNDIVCGGSDLNGTEKNSSIKTDDKNVDAGNLWEPNIDFNVTASHSKMRNIPRIFVSVDQSENDETTSTVPNVDVQSATNTERNNQNVSSENENKSQRDLERNNVKDAECQITHHAHSSDDDHDREMDLEKFCADQNSVEDDGDEQISPLEGGKSKSHQSEPPKGGPEPQASKSDNSSSASSSSHSSSSSSPSKFSFFKSIQNIMIATKWSKLRHGISKSSKQQNNNLLGAEERKSERQRKVSQKSCPGELRKKSQEGDVDENHEDTESGQDDHDSLGSSMTGHGKEKRTTHSRSHFSLFRRHTESPQPSPPSTPPPYLTEEQKTLVRNSWDEIRDNIGHVGVIAFVGLFETHPDAAESFDQFRGLSLDTVFNSISLKEHALRVMTTVEKFLNRIDRPDLLQNILEDLGRRHVEYRFKKEYIKVVGRQFIFAMRPNVANWTPETEAAWTALIDIMTYYMERGTYMESTSSTA